MHKILAKPIIRFHAPFNAMHMPQRTSKILLVRLGANRNAVLLSSSIASNAVAKGAMLNCEFKHVIV